MKSVNNVNVSPSQIVMGLLPAIVNSVKTAEFNAGNKLENALKQVEGVYTQTSVSKEISFQNVKEIVVKQIKHLVDHYHTSGEFSHALQLKQA